MTDDDLLDGYRDRLASVHMSTPADVVLALGDQRRHRRRVTRWSTAGGACVVALAVVLTLVVTGGSTSRAGAQLAAFTVSSGPDGASTVTLHRNSSERLDPNALRQALAARDITAKVTVGSWCDTVTEPAGLHQAITVGRDGNGDPTLTIHPDAVPAGAGVSIGYFSDRTVLALIRADAPLTCATSPRQAASQGQGDHEAIVLVNN